MTDRSNVQPESRAETLMASPDKMVKVRDAFGVDRMVELTLGAYRQAGAPARQHAQLREDNRND